MVHELPWFLHPSNLFLVIFFLYISGFILSSLFFHGFILKKKLESGGDKTFTVKESLFWFLFSVFWFLFSFVAFYYLTKSLFFDKKDKQNA